MTIREITPLRVRRSLFLVKIALLAAILLTNFSSNAFAAGSISGRVTIAGSSPVVGLQGVVINFYDFNSDDDGPSAIATTDVNGNYTIMLPASTYGVLTQNKQGYINEVYNDIKCSATCDTSLLQPVVVTDGGAATNVDFALDPGGRITGRVVKSSDGVTGIAGVTIWFVNSLPLNNGLAFTTAVTDATGNYISDAGTATGNVFVATRNTLGYLDEVYNDIKCGNCSVEGTGNPVPVTQASGASNINFALDAGGWITGTVTNTGGSPLANVEIRVVDPTGNEVGGAVTDAMGHYTTNGFPAGSYFLATGNHQGYVDKVYPNRFCAGGCNPTAQGGTTVAVVVGSATPNINFQLPQGGTVTGTVTKASDGTAVRTFVQFTMVDNVVGSPTFGQNIFVGGANTHSSGEYSIALPPGVLFAVVSDDPGSSDGMDGLANQLYHGQPCPVALATGFLACNQTAIGTPINVVAGTTTNNIDFTPPPGGFLNGSVTVGGTPTGNIQVQIFTLSGTLIGQVQSSSAGLVGAFTFLSLPAGQYYLRTNSGGPQINQMTGGVVCVQCNVTTTAGGTPVTVTAGTNTGIGTFALVNGGQIQGTITDASNGNRLGGILVQFFNAAGVQMGAFRSRQDASCTPAPGVSPCGAYSSSGLPPGNYFVKTATSSGQNWIDQAYNGITCIPCNVLASTAVTIVGTTSATNKNFALARRTLGDGTGDGKTDVAIFRPSSGIWYIRDSTTAGLISFAWGQAGDVPVAGDFDGDGRTDIAVFRPAAGVWFVRNSSTGLLTIFAWGQAGDVPVPADYDGDGKTDVAIFRAATGTWYVRNSSTGTLSAFSWGQAGDVAVAGDYDADGKADVAIFRAATGTWYVRNSSTGTLSAFSWGQNGDLPVAGDYDGDGKTDVAVFRAATGTWYVRNSSTGTLSAFSWGQAGDTPVTGDYDGDGKTDVAVFRDATGTWYVRNSSTGTLSAVSWGQAGDVPILQRP